MAGSPQRNNPLVRRGDGTSPLSTLKPEDHVYILRTRSLDETSPPRKRIGEATDDDNSQSCGGGAASALHSSFDAELLRGESDHNIECGSLFGDDEVDTSIGDLSGKKHLRPRTSTETLELNPPGTIRKQPRRANELNSKTPGRPRLRPAGSAKKPASSTPSSAAKRRRAPLPHRKSPMQRVPPTTPFHATGTTPKTSKKTALPTLGLNATYFVASPQALKTPSVQFSNNLKSTSKLHNTGTTAATTLLETTFESDSVDTSSPTTTRFKFTSFPASLPRVNNPRTRQCPDSVRKRMSFAESSPHNDANQSRDDDGTHNTSISSLSDGGHHHLPLAPGSRPPAMLELTAQHTRGSGDLDDHDAGPVHAKLFPEEEFGYSDDDSTDSPVRDIVGRTRLNFNMLLSPGSNEEEEDDVKLDTDGNAPMPLDLNMELSRPYDQKRINSFQSSLSSNTHMTQNTNNVLGCEEAGGSLTPARFREKDRPTTPREVQLHFPLETECSPIPGIREDHAYDDVVQPDIASNETSSLVGDELLPIRTKTTFDDESNKKEAKQKDDGSLASYSTNGKTRRLRPMPDMSAFEHFATASRGDRSSDDSTTLDSKGISSSHRPMCPPTPVRTPAWVNEGGAHAFLGARQNSLITTKVLLSVPSQVLAGRTSLESSVLDDDSKASRRRNVSATNDGVLNVGDISRDTDKFKTAFPSATGFAPDSIIKTPRIPAPPSLLRRIPSPQGVGSVISFSNDFDILRVLGSGAFADVYKVRFVRDNRLYAVKRNRRQFRGKRDRDMALGEVQSMQRLQSVCAETGASTAGASDKSSYCLYLLFFYSAWQEDGYFFCQTELCCRDTCRELLDSLRFLWNSAKSKYPGLLRNLPGPQAVEPGSEGDASGRLVPTMTIWKICHDIAAGLSHIHQTGLVHQDLKPSNIFFVAHPRFGAMCKIGDFGMAGEIGTSGDGLEGDARYMPLELLSSAARQASSDIFSLGLTLFETATDQHVEMPSEGPQWHELRRANGPHLPVNRDVELVQLIESMTNPDESQRPSADAILQNPKVIAAGHGRDDFLRDYILDIEEFDRVEDERLAMDCHEDQTPRNGSHRQSMMPVRSPSLSMLLPSAPSLLSPLAQPLHP